MSSSSMRSVFVCMLFCLAAVVNGAVDVDAYRLIQYGINGTIYGSSRAQLSHPAATLPAENIPTLAHDLTRKVAVLRLMDITKDTFVDIVETVQVTGIVLVLPSKSAFESDEYPLTRNQKYEIEKLEQYLVRDAKLSIPVYFVNETPELAQVIDDLQMGSSTSDKIQIQTKTSEASAYATVDADNIHGWLYGAPSSSSASVPTIAVVAHYDAFAPAPGLAVGLDQSASGVIALFELARIFNSIYSNVKQGGYNLLFVLTSASTPGFKGAEQWLHKADSRVLDSIELAICLDSIAAGDSLRLHMSKTPKVDRVQKFVNRLKSAAKAADVDFDIQVKKIKLNDPNVPWQHEWFSRFKVTAGTVSHVTEPGSLLERGSVLDLGDGQNFHEKLVRNIGVVAEAIARQVFEVDDEATKIVEGSLAVNEDLVSAWEMTFKNTPRFYPLIPRDSRPAGAQKGVLGLASQLEQYLRKYASDVKKQTFTLTSGWDGTIADFYSDAKATISIYRVKPFWFDLVYLAAWALYLALLFVAIKGPANLKLSDLPRDVMGLFSKSSSSKKRK